jgi:Transglycosylase SLT domain.
MTLKTSDRALRELIDDVARYRELPPWAYRGVQFDPGTLLEAIVITESAGDPRATRYEPHQDRTGRPDQVGDQDRPLVNDGPVEDDTSYGLMQVMGYNLKLMLGAAITIDGRRFPDPSKRVDFTLFFDPEVNLILATRLLCEEIVHVEKEIARGNRDPVDVPTEVIDRALMRYNGGPSGDDRQDDGTRRLQAYVDKVARNALMVKADRRNVGWPTSVPE